MRQHWKISPVLVMQKDRKSKLGWVLTHSNGKILQIMILEKKGVEAELEDFFSPLLNFA